MIGTGRWDAVCSSEFGVQPVSAATEELVAGHLTAVFKIIDGNWQIIYQHASAPGQR
jgi:hypothetical protein